MFKATFYPAEVAERVRACVKFKQTFIEAPVQSLHGAYIDGSRAVVV